MNSVDVKIYVVQITEHNTLRPRENGVVLLKSDLVSLC
jgi:hypothetical protein